MDDQKAFSEYTLSPQRKRQLLLSALSLLVGATLLAMGWQELNDWSRKSRGEKIPAQIIHLQEIEVGIFSLTYQLVNEKNRPLCKKNSLPCPEIHSLQTSLSDETRQSLQQKQTASDPFYIHISSDKKAHYPDFQLNTQAWMIAKFLGASIFTLLIGFALWLGRLSFKPQPDNHI
ncbi:hypothetical protein ACQZV8_15730 [Magnetococcales bacterium HHB-1]